VSGVADSGWTQKAKPSMLEHTAGLTLYQPAPESAARQEAFYRLATSLAKPVARGYLTLGQAHASLICRVLQAERDGDLAPYAATDVFSGLRHVLGLNLENLERDRALAELRIRWRIRPMIAVRRPSNVLRAEAHDLNGAAGFPLSEDEVDDIAAEEVWHSMSRIKRHG
jgi:hypothetical protein